MKFLLDIPIVVSVAEWVWNVDPVEAGVGDPLTSAEICLPILPFMNLDCWSRLVIKGLGIAIILGACLNKAPVIRNILSARATAGLSRGAVLGETIMYANGASYGTLSGHPFSAYGENVALLIQSIVIVLLIWKFSTPAVSMGERGIVVAVAAIYLVTVSFFLTEELYYLLMSINVPILLYSRGSQILETYRCQHTGAQSIITTTMNLVGGLIRILTLIHEVGWDLAVLVPFGLSVSLNIVCFSQHFYYRSNTEKFMADLQAKKKQQ